MTEEAVNRDNDHADTAQRNGIYGGKPVDPLLEYAGAEEPLEAGQDNHRMLTLL